MMKKLLATAMLYGICNSGISENSLNSNDFIAKNKFKSKGVNLENKFEENFFGRKDTLSYNGFLDLYFDKKKGEFEKEENGLGIFKEEYLDRRKVERIVDSLYSKMNVPSLISKDFFLFAVENESRFNKNAVSPVGARGLAQIMPETWNYYNPDKDFENHSFDPVLNLETGIKVYKAVYHFVEKHNPDWENLSNEEKLANLIAGYNWGIGSLKNIAKWDLSQVPNETKKYIDYVSKKLI